MTQFETADDAGRTDLPEPCAPPGISVVIPVLNEQRYLRTVVDRVLSSTYGGPLQVVLALGPSTDGTSALAAEIAAADARVTLVANPTGRTAAGLNAAIRNARFSVIARVDGHALIPQNYLAVAWRALYETKAANVGGVMAAEGETDFEQAVAAAMRSWFGVGGAAFHIGGQAGPALTVYLGVFQRSAIEEAGGFDETMVRAQDWELNHRIRAQGGLIWFTPDLEVTYRPRGSINSLARQYWQYGRWRREVTRRHPETVSPRYLAPPATVLAVTVASAITIAAAASGHPRIAGVASLVPLGYASGNIAASLIIGRHLSPAVRHRLPIVLATMHGAWGAGFLRWA